MRREQGCLVALPVADCVSSFSARFRTNLSNEFLFYGLADIFLQKLKTASEKKAYLWEIFWTITAPHMFKETSGLNLQAYFSTFMAFFGKTLQVSLWRGVRIAHQRVIGKFWNSCSSRLDIRRILAI